MILSQDEIKLENERMQKESPTLNDLKITSTILSNQQVLNLILDTPSLSSNISKDILENRNLKTIAEEVFISYGITIKKAILKYYPTDENFQISPIVKENIATAIPFATPILLIHQSKDYKWYYIECEFYKGWLKVEEILLLSQEQFYRFLHPKNFITITTPLLFLFNSYLDMGIKLPLLAVHNKSYEILIPTKQGIEIQRISKNIAVNSFLPFTKENVVLQAKKYLGLPYIWGGIENGVDCSFFLFSLFKTFGLNIPRDTSEQEKIVGIKRITLKEKTENEKRKILKMENYPAVLYKNGHVLLLISANEVIHAYGKARKVILSTIDNCLDDNLYPFLTTLATFIK